jgi:cytoskeletal protein RodZ
VTGGDLHGPPDDPSNRPTRMASYSAGDMQPPDSDDNPDYSESPEPESPPDPWYRNRLLLAVWATMVAILVVLIIYGLIQLSRGSAGGPSITTPSTTPAPSSTPTRSSTPTPSTTTTTPPPPPTSEEQQPPGGNSAPPAQSPPPAEPPRHHHHLPHIPSTIPLPHTVITLPPGF